MKKSYKYENEENERKREEKKLNNKARSRKLNKSY